MPDTVLLALQNKLARYEADGMTDQVKRVKARIAELEKGEKAATKLPMTLTVSTEAPVTLGATVTTTNPPKPTVKKAVKKATKAQARKKK